MSAETLRRAAAEIRKDWPENREMGMDRHEWRFHRAVADMFDDFIAIHFQRDSSSWSALHRDADHYEGDPRCTEACIEEFSLCNGCGTRECHEITRLLPVARAYLGESA